MISEKELRQEAYTKNDGMSWRCKTCFTVLGSIGEARECRSPVHENNEDKNVRSKNLYE